jgi:uncharacterized protein (DUF488 family)
MKELYTIGHSNHSLEIFLSLLQQHSITALCDVRSHPYSKHHPQFSYQFLKEELKKHGIVYVFLGKELGARSTDSGCYKEGKVQYARLAQTQIFQEGLNRLNKGIESYRIALMCAEKDPLNCHRTILICRHLRTTDLMIKHILEDGRVETQTEAEQRLIDRLNLPKPNLLTNFENLIEQAYNIQDQKIAYVNLHLETLAVREEENNYGPDFTLHDRLYPENCRTIF